MWGPQFHVLYNDAYMPILGDKVRMGQGITLGELWSEISEAACAIAERAYAGESSSFDDQLFVLERHGAPERAFFTFSYSPVRDDTGVAVGVLCTIVETTDKVMAHAQLKESEERLQISLDASDGIGTWSYDPETNETIVDERFSALFQVDAALAQEGTELERFTNMIHPDDRERVIAAIGHAIQSGEPYNIEYRIPQLSGKIVWVNVKGRMFGRRFAGVAVDITERKVADDKLRQLAADLSETSQRKTEFLATLAHELRNPLAPLRTGLELMGVTTDPAALLRVKRMMQRQVDQLVHLVDDLMDMARINSGKVELKLGQVDIKDAIASAIESIMPHVQKAGHALLTELPDESLLVRADSTRLAQVLGNILTNASKYTQSEGRIVVSARRVADQIVISVSDNGIGIPSTSLPTVFEMFNQVGRDTTHSHGGLGIGLALVRQLVELHGGTVVATSAGIDQGSTFRITLPAASEQDAECAPIEAVPSADASSEKLRIMIADDNADARAALSALLQFEGHQVLSAANGEEAIYLAQSFLPELIFLDIGMPGKNGHEVAKIIRTLPTLHQSILVALTGWGTDQDRTLSHEAGFDQHLTKPVTLAAINRVLRAVPANRNNK
jgi:signal transduction histidine kinase/ActR/RegA family two-component response regulator